MDDIRPEDSASQVGGQYLGTMSSVGGATRKTLPPPPPPPMSGSPKLARSRPGVPPQSSATSAPMQPPPAPKLPAKFSQDPPQGEIASSSTRPDVARPKTPPKRPPIKTPPVKSMPKKAKASEPTEIKGSVRRMQPRTPSPKRAVEEMARNDVAARGSAPVRAEGAKAAPAEFAEVVTPVSEEGHGDAPGLVQGRLSAVTDHGPPVTSGVSSQAPTPTSPAGDSALGEATAAPGSTHWSSAPIVSPLPAGGATGALSTPWSAAPMASGSETEVCVACQGSGLLNSQVNLRLFRLIGSGQLRLSGPAPSTPAVPKTPTGPPPPERSGNGGDVSPSLSENSGRSRTPTCSGVCGLSEDGSMAMFDSGGNLLFLELACGVDSVIQNASREFGSSYIGIHAGLELLPIQRQAYKFLKSFGV